MSLSQEALEKKARSLDEKNKRLEKQVRELSLRCKMQEKVLAASGCATLQSLLDQFVIYSKTQLKQIRTEIRFLEFDPDAAVAIYQFREFLLSIHTQLGEFMALPDKVLHSEMGRVREKYIEIGKTIDLLRMLSEDEIEALVDEEDRLHEYIRQLAEEKRQL
ncbi:MAG: hypothetical protein J6N99_07035 [Schwartzia sp.]|nr:hypothetical protein [Schwartzia sp. (in: firmicutes)]